MPESEPVMQVLDISQATDQFSHVVDQVFRKESRVLIERSGLPVAAIVSAEDLDQLRRMEDAERAARDRMRAAFAGKSDDELLTEVSQVVEQVRQEERERQAAQQ